MSQVPKLVADPVRLDSLSSFNILDTAREESYDDVVMLARKLCDTPIALVSLVADNRQWFKAVSGLSVCETPINQSVCAHALEQGTTLNIPDLTQDPRTKHNTLVTGAPFIRFYAGALLKAPDGQLLGTVCVIDTEPRPGGLTPDQIESLEALARQVMAHLELRRAKLDADRLYEALRDNELRLRLAQEAGQIGSFEIDVVQDVLTATEQFCRVYGLPHADVMRPDIVEKLVIDEDRSKVSSRLTRQKPGTPTVVEYRIAKPDTGDIVWVARRAQFIVDEDGKPLRMLGTVHDVTDRKLAEDQLKFLNDELGHRMKNSMTLVQAIASQSFRGTTHSPELKAFNQRIAVLSHAHDIMLAHNWSGAKISEIVARVLTPHAVPSRLQISGPRVDLDSKATLSLSLLLHELATNAIKYGALSVPEGHVEIAWSTDDANLTLQWVERGGPAVAPPERRGMGSRLIDMGLVGTSRATKSYDPDGFRAEFIAPLAMVEVRPTVVK